MQRPTETLGKVDAELVGADRILHRALFLVRQIDLAPLKELLNLRLVARIQRLLRELLLVGGKAAVLALPDTIAIGIHTLIVHAEILIRSQRDETRLQLRRMCLFPTDRTRLLNRICVLCHDSSSLPENIYFSIP